MKTSLETGPGKQPGDGRETVESRPEEALSLASSRQRMQEASELLVKLDKNPDVPTDTKEHIARLINDACDIIERNAK